MWRSSLAVILNERGLSLAELVRRTGLSNQTISNAYHGWYVSRLTMMLIARALDVPLAVLDPVAAQELDGLVIRQGCRLTELAAPLRPQQPHPACWWPPRRRPAARSWRGPVGQPAGPLLSLACHFSECGR